MTAWHRKALERPAPWARAMRAIERETLAAFYRPAGGDDGMGGFEGEAITSWSIDVHAEMQRDAPAVGSSEPGGVERVRRWVLFVPLRDLSPELMPQQGDRVAFTDQVGLPVDVLVTQPPWVPDGLADHLRVDTEALL